MSQVQGITSEASGIRGETAATGLIERPMGEGGNAMASGGRCPNGHENSATARFCRDCGQPLEQLPPVNAPVVGAGTSDEVTQKVPPAPPAPAEPPTQAFPVAPPVSPPSVPPAPPTQMAPTAPSVPPAPPTQVNQMVPPAPVVPPTQGYAVPPAVYQPPVPPPADRQAGPARRGSWSMVLVTVLAVAVVALGAVLAAVKLSGGSSSAPVVHTSTGGRSAALPNTRSATTVPTPTTSSTSMVQAQAVSSLLQNSAQDRSEIVAAVSEVTSCGDLAGAQATLDQAAASRRSLLTQLGQLQTGALPNGAQLVSDLEAAWQASLDSDNSYAAYAGDEMSNFGGCVPNDPNDSNAQAAATSDNQATTAKTEFVNLWNPVASTYGLTQWQASNL